MTPTQQRVLVERLVIDAVQKERLIWEKVAAEEMENQRKLWMNRCIMACAASFIADLMDKWDWTPEQVEKLMTQSETNFEMMLDEFVTLDDFTKWVKERGVNINLMEGN